MSFWCLQISQQTNKIFSRISVLGSKKRSKQKNTGHFIPLIGGFYFDFLKLLFWFDLFLEARAEVLEKISLGFFGRFELYSLPAITWLECNTISMSSFHVLTLKSMMQSVNIQSSLIFDLWNQTLYCRSSFPLLWELAIPITKELLSWPFQMKGESQLLGGDWLITQLTSCPTNGLLPCIHCYSYISPSTLNTNCNLLIFMYIPYFLI